MTELEKANLKNFTDEMALRKQRRQEQASQSAETKNSATHLPSEPYLEPTDEEVMEATKRVLVCGKNGCGGPKSMEQRRTIYRIMKESGIFGD